MKDLEACNARSAAERAQEEEDNIAPDEDSNDDDGFNDFVEGGAGAAGYA